jgi:hypothetical protein
MWTIRGLHGTLVVEGSRKVTLDDKVELQTV